MASHQLAELPDHVETSPARAFQGYACAYSLCRSSRRVFQVFQPVNGFSLNLRLKTLAPIESVTKLINASQLLLLEGPCITKRVEEHVIDAAVCVVEIESVLTN